MVLLTITPRMLEAIHKLQHAGTKADTQQLVQPVSSEEPSLEDPYLGNPISHGQVIELAQKWGGIQKRPSMNEADLPNTYSLEALLRGSRIYSKAPKTKAEPTSEYRALMARLRQDEESRIYNQMTDSSMQKESFAQRFPGSQHAHLFPTSKTDIGEDDETTLNDINRQIAVIFNVIVSIIACSAAIWIVARHWSIPTRLGLSMGGSGLVGAAEVVVYAGYLRRVKEAKLKEKKAIEVKEVVDTWVINGKPSHAEVERALTAEATEPESVGLRKRATHSKVS